MRAIENLLSEYSESHRNETNKLIHWICVPLIFFSSVGLFYAIKLPFHVMGIHMNVAIIIMVFVLFYYFSLSKTLFLGMLVYSFISLYLCHAIETKTTAPLWLVSTVIFVIAWIFQFYGHKVEGKKPSFLKDLQFLLIGPAWVISFVYEKTGIKL